MAASAQGSGGGNGQAGDGYDQVRLPKANGDVQLMTRAEFENLPLVDRVHHLIGGKLTFLRNGTPVAAREALRRG
jgi:hypothetical protein